jgi:CrcB protein
MQASLWVAFGGALGSVGRYWTALWVARLVGETFPWGTLLINVLGSFVIGLVATLTLTEGALPASMNARLFVMAGICGGYTTFSAFSLQTLALARAGHWFWALGYVGSSVVLCLASVTAGHMLALRLGMAWR